MKSSTRYILSQKPDNRESNDEYWEETPPERGKENRSNGDKNGVGEEKHREE